MSFLGVELLQNSSAFHIAQWLFNIHSAVRNIAKLVDQCRSKYQESMEAIQGKTQQIMSWMVWPHGSHARATSFSLQVSPSLQQSLKRLLTAAVLQHLTLLLLAYYVRSMGLDSNLIQPEWWRPILITDGVPIPHTGRVLLRRLQSFLDDSQIWMLQVWVCEDCTPRTMLFRKSFFGLWDLQYFCHSQ